MKEKKVMLMIFLGVFLYTSFMSLYGFALSNEKEKEGRRVKNDR